MCDICNEIYEEGMKKGIEEGREKERENLLEKINEFIIPLTKKGIVFDTLKLISDEDYRNELMKMVGA